MDLLGINYSLDSAAAFLRDGKVLAAVTDERFTKEKHSHAFPTQSIEYCLRYAGTDLAGVDCVAFFWNPGIHLQSFNVRRSSSVRHHTEYLSSLPNHLLAQYPLAWDALEVEHVEQSFAIRGADHPLRIVYVTHHRAHAASAFFLSPFEEAAILTVDGYGEQTSAFLGEGRGNKLWSHQEIAFPHSLGAFYAAVTQYLGFQANCEEGKVMGLAAYGEPVYADEMRKLVSLGPEGTFEVDLSFFGFHQERARRYSSKWVGRFGPERERNAPLEARHHDIAASAQQVLEDTLVHMARHVQTITGQRALCLAGGVALNCVANSRVADEAGFDDVFIQPAAGDNGTSLGAALYVQHQLHDAPRESVVHTDALGPEFSDDEIEVELRENRVRYERCGDIARVAAQRIANGEIIGWFQGRMEFGPRALGQRSILGDPRRPETKQVLDERIKRRETFRPYAPAVLREAQNDYFTGPGDSPFMLKSYDVRPDKRASIPSVVHVDGSARVQTVERTSNPRFYELIEAFGGITGVPVVLNTSFNGRGETMVCDVADALRCFYSTGLDALAIGRWLVRK